MSGSGQIPPTGDDAERLRAALASCENEPIHRPGSIQSHGVLLALRGPARAISHVSDSCEALLGLAVGELLGRELGAALGRELDQAVIEALARHEELPDLPVSFPWSLPGGERAFTGHVHFLPDPRSSLSPTILELELSPGELAPGVIGQAARAAGQVRARVTVAEKAQTAAEWLRRLTGYDRVMIYRFHEDWHGEVIAEARRADLEPFLGLHYPASDIPAQARRLYLTSPTRLIVDVDHRPSPLHRASELPPDEASEPLDLSRCVLRSVSPVHLQYLRNMGVRATMVTSLLRDGQLWGLVSCQHHGPRALPGGMRSILDWMTQDLATQIALAEEASHRAAVLHLRESRDFILREMRKGARLRSFIEGPQLAALLGAVGAEGVALVLPDGLITGGITPEASQIRAILEGLRVVHAKHPPGLFATDCLGELLPSMAGLAAVAAGVVAIPLEAGSSLQLVWFRREQWRLVDWGGNPDKRDDLSPEGLLNPRRSFALWTESVQGRSLRWKPEELESARELGATLDLELRRTTEDSLRTSGLLLRGLIDSMTTQIAVLDPQGVITSVNQAWRQAAEQSGEVCLPGADYLAACLQDAEGPHQAEALAAHSGISEVLGGQRPFFQMERMRVSALGVRWFTLRAFALGDSHLGVVVAHEDITERMELAQRLDLKRVQLEDLNRSLEKRVSLAVAELRSKDRMLIAQSRQAAMGEMLGNIAHQWRQPLTALGLVLANIGDAAHEAQVSRGEVLGAVADGNRLIQRMSSTIDDFRDFFRPDKVRVAFSAIAEIRKTLGLIEASYRHAGISLVLVPCADQRLFGVPNEFSQVLLNLLANARQAIAATGAVPGWTQA